MGGISEIIQKALLRHDIYGLYTYKSWLIQKPFGVWNEIHELWSLGTMVKSKPNSIGNKPFVVKCNRLAIEAVEGHALRFPAVRSFPEERHVAYLVRAWPCYVKFIRQAPLESPWCRVIQSWGIYLIFHHHF